MPSIPTDLAALLDALEELLGSSALAARPTRDDDVALVRATRERLRRRYTLAVVGEFSSGKSYLLNALLGKTRYDERGRIKGLLATDINPSTATITELEYGSPETAFAKFPSGRTERIPMDRLARFVAVAKDAEAGALHAATADDDAAPNFVVVTLDSPFLQSGFVVADTPGLASLNPAHRRATLSYLPRTDAVLYLIDTQQPFSDGDAAFLGSIGEHVRTVFIVQTKIDLWRMHEPDGTQAWRAARARIVARAERFAPRAEVYSVSARDYAAGTLESDAALITTSGFPDLLDGLERSLEERAQRARSARALAIVAELTARLSAHALRETALDEMEAQALSAVRERTQRELLERERSLARERDDVTRAGVERRAWIAARGAKVADVAVRALGSAIDVADIERVRDRGRFHSLVDGTVAPVWNAFGAEIANDVARELDRIAKNRSYLRVADLAAERLGGEAGTGAWSRDLASGITATIVLGALGGPAVTFVDGVARAFGAHPRGSYMKRELGADLAQALFPALERDVTAFANDIADRVASVYDAAATGIDHERALLRAETLAPIDRALAIAGDSAARLCAQGELAVVAQRLAAIDAGRLRLAPAGDAEAQAPAATVSAGHDAQAAFDADAYDLGLRPQRYRVVVLGALGRGKSSLINAIAGTRLLSDGAASEALFPIHVRYGERERAYALERQGLWRDIALEAAVAQAAHSPVLIEVPWKMPRELVLVHAPAFDSGGAAAEAIALAAAEHASETLGLFSRQLSDRELGLYARVAEFGKPMLLAHTIADNESAHERRTVVDLAGRYVRERGLNVARIFTISALDYFEAAQTHRMPAPWNELAALRDTLEAHAQEHMRRYVERERLAASLARVQPEPSGETHVPKLRGALERLFGRAVSRAEPHTPIASEVRLTLAPNESRVPRSYVLGPAQIALGTGQSIYGRVAIENGRIARVLAGDGATDYAVPAGAFIAPGMIDVHTNGANDALFNRDQGHAVEVASRSYAARGSTGFIATVMTAPWESMLHAASEVAEAAHEIAERPVTGARCLGIHFEGPFLNPKFRRVHRLDWLQHASLEKARALVESCRGALAIVTMAPEVEGVDEAARYFYDQGIVVSAGHTAARYREGLLAISLGFRTLTHAFNAMPPLDHRDPSILAAFMQDERTTVQAICDGFHISPVMVDLLYRSLGDRLALATDYMAPAGAGYRIEGGVVRAEDGTIAGSALHQDHAVRNLMSYASIPFERAIVNATATPARILGIERDCGTIEVGKRADLVVWDAHHEVVTTIVGGEAVYGSHDLASTRTSVV